MSLIKAIGNTPITGDIGLMKIGGDTGRLIRIAQWLGGKGFANYEHAVIVMTVQYPAETVTVVEAEPGGARINHYKHEDVLFLRWQGISAVQRMDIVEAARRYAHTPYSFLDYLALVLHTLHIPFPGLKRYIASTKHMICSQLVDQVYQDAGIQLFDDHRWPGYVTPEDIYNLAR